MIEIDIGELVSHFVSLPILVMKARDDDAESYFILRRTDDEGGRNISF